MTRLLIVVAVVAGLGGLFLFGLLRGSPDRDIPSQRVGRPAPAFELPVLEPVASRYGDTYGTADLEGRPAVINFWATWCPPCRAEAPLLEAAWQAYGDRVTVLGVQSLEPGAADKGAAFVNEFGLTFPNVHDGDNRVGIEYGVFGMPETFFVRADGTVAYKHAGELSAGLLEEKIEEILQ